MSWKRYAGERAVATAAVFVLTLAAIFVLFRSGLFVGPEGLGPVAYPYDGTGGIGRKLWDFVVQLAHGRLGGPERQDLRAPDSGRHLDSTQEALAAARVSVAVALGGLAIGVGIGVPVGLRWGRSRGRRGARRFAIAFGAALAPVLIWADLQYWLGFRWGVTPIVGYCDAFDPAVLADGRIACGGLREWSSHLVLPWLTLGIGFVALYVDLAMRLAREIRDDRDRDPAGRLRRALVRRLGRDFGVALGAAAFVELLFGLPGLGWRALSGWNIFRFGAVEAVLIVAAALALGVHLLVDLIAARDPLYRAAEF